MFLIRFRIAALLALFGVGCAPVPPMGARPARMPVAMARPERPEAPALTQLKNGHYRVTRPWTVVLDGREWHVQKGYKSNGITAPSKLKHELGDGVDHPETWAAVFHDWLFTQPGMSRSKADGLFYQLLLAYGVPQIKARLMYAGVSAYTASKTHH